MIVFIMRVGGKKRGLSKHTKGAEYQFFFFGVSEGIGSGKTLLESLFLLRMAFLGLGWG